MSAGGWNFVIDQSSFSRYSQNQTHETHQTSLALHQTRILHGSTGVERNQDRNHQVTLKMKEFILMTAIAMLFIFTISVWKRATQSDYTICPLCNQHTQ
jgi:hypothetical protein